jgi:drug/metabolite transporter (DMT)-like permease
VSERSAVSGPGWADIASLAVCTIIWSTTWRAIKLQLGGPPAMESVVYRFALASALLFLCGLASRRSVRLTGRQHLEALAQGLTGFSLQYSLVYLAEERVSSGATAVIFAGIPFVNLLLFHLFRGQRTGPAAWIAAALGLIGVAILSLSQASGGAAAIGAATGVAMALVGVLCAGLGNLFADRAHAAGSALIPSTAWAMAYGAGLLAIYVTLTGHAWSFEPSVRYVGSLVYLAAFGSVIAFLAYYGLARRRGYALASYVAALTPPAAMAISSVTEGARWGPGALAGLGLVLVGQAILIRRKSR